MTNENTNNENRNSNDGENANSAISRRSALRKAGGLAVGLGILGTQKTKALEQDRQYSVPENNTSTITTTESSLPDGDGDGSGGVSTEAMTSASSKFSPYSITTSETAVLNSTWEFASPVPGNNYQLDIIIHANHIYPPQTVSTNLGAGGINKDWEYRSSSPIGPAFHWQWKGWVADGMGASRYVDAEITPLEAGEVQANTGTFWPYQDWAVGYLTIE
ncbi:hypothetical protein [Halorubellus salinus]|uniref:hypothetical protein n=1 Tax=Halorubellus salinus TaxID=755309 RepID=UPI001D06430F|nr:hypothetical protein [Halorubellus salinus]